MASPVRDRDLRPPLRVLRGTPGWGQQPPAPSRLQHGRATPAPTAPGYRGPGPQRSPTNTRAKNNNNKKEKKRASSALSPPALNQASRRGKIRSTAQAATRTVT
ncbi:hypothetical protein NDU88_002599 [Pleurodeles waltl]|uniref:Uncharacterized protein n=1 Tax=Pleurodeles waltl TaxID=8319 RepID=A0AAV7LJ87_PLEWA|nr:hypothetical protein NDU88_002599 [Pleurodeles waltl]